MAANSYRTEDGIIKAARAAKLPRWMYDTPEAWKALIRLIDQQCGPQLPSEIDRSKHGSVLMVWNDCMINNETLEMTWPKLVKAMQEAEKRTDR